MTITWMQQQNPGWDGPDDSPRWSDLALTDFLERTAVEGLRSPDERAFFDFVKGSPSRVRIERRRPAIPPVERDRARAIERGVKHAGLVAFTERQMDLGERILRSIADRKAHA